MTAAVQCDRCGKFTATDVAGWAVRQHGVVLPENWFYVHVQPSGPEVAGYTWHVCSLRCATYVANKVADRGELP